MASENETEQTDIAMRAPSIGPHPDQEQSMLVNESAPVYDGSLLLSGGSASASSASEGIGSSPLIRQAQVMHQNSLSTLKENGFSENLHRRYRHGSTQGGRSFSISLKGIKQWISHRKGSWEWQHGYLDQRGFPLNWRLRRLLSSENTVQENLAVADRLQSSPDRAFSMPRRRLEAIPFRRRVRGTRETAYLRRPEQAPMARGPDRTVAVPATVLFPGHSTDQQQLTDSDPAGAPSRFSGYGPALWPNRSIRVSGKMVSGLGKLARGRIIRPMHETGPSILTVRAGSTLDQYLPLHLVGREPVLPRLGPEPDSGRFALPLAKKVTGTPQNDGEGLVGRSASPQHNQNHLVLGPSPAVGSVQEWRITPSSTKAILAVNTNRGGITGAGLEMGTLSTRSGKRRPSKGEGKSAFQHLFLPLATGRTLTSIARTLGDVFAEKKNDPANLTAIDAQLASGRQSPATIGTTAQSQGFPLDRLSATLHFPIIRSPSIKSPGLMAYETESSVPARARQAQPFLVKPTDASQASPSRRVGRPSPSGALAERPSEGRSSHAASANIVKDGQSTTPAKPGLLPETSPKQRSDNNRITAPQDMGTVKDGRLTAPENTRALKESLSQGTGPLLASKDPNLLRRLRQQSARSSPTIQEKKQPLSFLPGDGTDALAEPPGGLPSTETQEQGISVQPQSPRGAGAATQIEQPSSTLKSTGPSPDLPPAVSGNDPATSNPISTIREPQTMSNGLASRLGKALHWRAPLVSDGSTGVVTFQPGLNFQSSPIARRVKWDSADLSPMVADKEYQDAPDHNALPRMLFPSLRPVPSSVTEADRQAAPLPAELSAREDGRGQFPSPRFYVRENKGVQTATDQEENRSDLTDHLQSRASDINRRQPSAASQATRISLELIRGAVRILRPKPLTASGGREETGSQAGTSSRLFRGNESQAALGRGVRSTSGSPNSTPTADANESGLYHKNADEASGHERGKRVPDSSILGKPWHILRFPRRVETKGGTSISSPVQRSEATMRRQSLSPRDVIQIRETAESPSAPVPRADVPGPVRIVPRNQSSAASPVSERNPLFIADFENSTLKNEGLPEYADDRSSTGKPEMPGQRAGLKGILERTRRFVMDSRELVLPTVAPVLGREKDDVAWAEPPQRDSLRPSYRSASLRSVSLGVDRTDGGSHKETADFQSAANRPSHQVLQGQSATPARPVPSDQPGTVSQRRHRFRSLGTVLSRGAPDLPGRRAPGHRGSGRSILTGFLNRAGIVSRLPLAGRVLTLRQRRPAKHTADSARHGLARSHPEPLQEIVGIPSVTASVSGRSEMQWNGSTLRPDTHYAASQIQEQDRSVPSVLSAIPQSASDLTGKSAYPGSASEGRRGALQRVHLLVAMAGQMVMRRPKTDIATAPFKPQSQPAPARPERTTGTLIFRSIARDSKEQNEPAPRQPAWSENSMPSYLPVSMSTWSSSMLRLPLGEGAIPSMTSPSRMLTTASRQQQTVRRRPTERMPAGQSGEKLTMAQLLDSANAPPQKQDLLLQAVTGGKSAGGPSLPGSAGGITSDKGRVLRRQTDVPDPKPDQAADVPMATLARRPRSGRRSNSGSSGQASEHGGRDVTDFKGWEIEFLASKVYGYLQRKLDIERERHGRAGFNPWL